MARDHGRLRWRLWSDPEFLRLDRDEQWLYMLFLGQPGLSFAGVLSRTDNRWATLAAGTDPGVVQKALRGLVASGWVLVDERTDEVYLRNHAEDDGLLDAGPNMAKALTTAYHQITSRVLRAAILIELHAMAELPDGHRPGSAACWEHWQNKKEEQQPPALAPLLSLRLPVGLEPGFTAGLGGQFRRELPGWLDSEWAEPLPRPIVAGDVRQPFRHRTAKPLTKPLTEPSNKPSSKGLSNPSTEPSSEGHPNGSPQGSTEPLPEPSAEPSPQPSPNGSSSRARTPAPAPSPTPALPPPAPAEPAWQALTHDADVDAVVAEASWRRPDWKRRQIELAVARARTAGHGLLATRGALLAAADDPATEAPARITHRGPWWERDDLADLPDLPPWCRCCDMPSSRQVRDATTGGIKPCPTCHPSTAWPVQSAAMREASTA